MHIAKAQRDVLQKVIKRTIKMVNNYSPELSLEKHCEKYQVCQSLRLIDVDELHFDAKAKNIKESIGIWSLFDSYPLRISFYYVPLGWTVKLHDHPTMEVVNYLLKGKMQSDHFTHIQNDVYSKRTQIFTPGSFGYIDGLKSNHENLHEFYAIEPTYFLDIIFPDYDESRECNFYEQVEKIDEKTSRLKVLANYNREMIFSDLI